MTLLTRTKICLFWYQICHNSAARYVPWNGSAAANPDTLQGGIPFDTGACMDEPLYATVTGTGDAQVTWNPGAGSFAGPVPETYQRGWPGLSAGSVDHFDAASLQGSAVLGPSNVQASFPTIPGAARGENGVVAGRYYFEYGVTYDIFSNLCGMGVMRRDALMPYLGNGEQNVADNIGGCMVSGGSNSGSPTYQVSVNKFGSNFAPEPWIAADSGTTIGIAVAIIPQFRLVPTVFSAQGLPRLICCPIQRFRALALAARRGTP